MSATDATSVVIPRPLRRSSVDREFLPAALEILETPPSPVRMYLLLLICAFVVAAVTWSLLGRIDIIAIAQGRIQPSGRVKLVQPIEMGRVRLVHVQNGGRVQQGDALIELDDREARAEQQALLIGVAALRAEAIRRAAALNMAKSRSFIPPALVWSAEVPGQVRTREEHILSSDIGQLSAMFESLSAQLRQKDAERKRLQGSISSQEQTLDIQRRRVEMREQSERLKVGSLSNLIDAQDMIQQQRTALAQLNGQLGETMAARETLERDVSKLFGTFIAENTQKLGDAERQADDMSQRLVKAGLRVANMTLRAPAAGLVQGSSVTSIGQVLMPGDEVMRIVPEDYGIEIECYLPNKDIGFVSIGQEAIVKIDSFPFTRYGSLTARILRIGGEPIPEPDVAQLESSAGKQAIKNTFLGGAQRVQNLVFPLSLKPEQTTIDVDGFAMPVSNGMTVSVEIKTGSRRIIDYVFSPLVEVGSRALKER